MKFVVSFTEMFKHRLCDRSASRKKKAMGCLVYVYSTRTLFVNLVYIYTEVETYHQVAVLV